MSEFRRMMSLADLPAGSVERDITANTPERAALAVRFGLRALDRLDASLEVRRTADGAEIKGRVRAVAVQACVVSGVDVPVVLDEPLLLRFSRFSDPSGEERELLEGDLDVLPVEEGGIDLGEAVAQSLGVALDPYPRASDAELEQTRRRLTSEEEAAEALARERARQNPFRVIEGGAKRD